MAENSNLLNNIIRMACSYDDAAWETFANRGLLKRAKKDFEKGIRPVIKTDSSSEVTAVLNEFTIRIPEQGFAKARCSCASPSVCHHIILAGLVLAAYDADQTDENRLPGDRQSDTDKTDIHQSASLSEGDDTNAAAQELAGIDLQSLISWAQKRNIVKACALLDSEPQLSIKEEKTIRFIFPVSGCEAIFVPGGGPGGMIISGTTYDKKVIAAACIIAYWRQKGISCPEIDELVSAQPVKQTGRNTVRSIDHDLVSTIRNMLCEIIASGISHVSGFTADRFYSLACTASASGLPRLSGMLKTIADLTRLLVRRDAASDPAELFRQTARAHSLCLALDRKSPDDHETEALTGIARSSYEDMKSLELSGLGAYVWQTGSGYTGITLLFLGHESREIFSFSDSRPLHQRAGFNPAASYHEASIWQAGISLEHLCRSTFTLNNPKINSGGRISSSAESHCSGIRNSALTQEILDAVALHEWQAAAEKAIANRPAGLALYDPRSDIVILKPKQFGKKEFDPVTQTFTWQMFDRAGAMLLLRVVYAGWNEKVLNHLQVVGAASAHFDYVIGRISRTGNGISILPCSFVSLKKNTVEYVNPGLDERAAAAPSILSRIFEKISPSQFYDPDPEAFADADSKTLNTKTGRLLSALERELSLLAEAGLGAGGKQLSSISETTPEKLEGYGLTVLGKYARQISSAPLQPEQLLVFMYLVMLHRELLF